MTRAAVFAMRTSSRLAYAIETDMRGAACVIHTATHVQIIFPRGTVIENIYGRQKVNYLGIPSFPLE